jgi:hypothetical protein
MKQSNIETITYSRYLDYLHTIATCISSSPTGRIITPHVSISWEDLDNPIYGRYGVRPPAFKVCQSLEYIHFWAGSGSILILPHSDEREFGEDEYAPCLIGGIQSRVVDCVVPERPLIRLRAMLEDLGILPSWWGPMVRVRFRAPVIAKIEKYG